MDEYADIYYVDGRNADPRDHRTNRPAGGWRPSGGGAANTPGRVIVTTPAAPAYPTVPAYPPSGYAMAPYGASAPMAPTYTLNPYTGQLVPAAPGTALGALFGSMPIGQILELVAAGFAALASLPSAPIATKDMETDLANLILYQSALATHAKRDEQIRTIGSLVGKLVR